MYSPEYFKQLTAEQLVTKIYKGYPKSEWQKMRERNEAEISTISQLTLVITITIFSIILILLNILLDWEHWTVPLIVTAGAACLFTYVSEIFAKRTETYLYSIILILEAFYYTVHAESTGLDSFSW